MIDHLTPALHPCTSAQATRSVLIKNMLEGRSGHLAVALRVVSVRRSGRCDEMEQTAGASIISQYR